MFLLYKSRVVGHSIFDATTLNNKETSSSLECAFDFLCNPFVLLSSKVDIH